MIRWNMPANSQLNLRHGTKQKLKSNEETKYQKTEMLRRNGPVVKSVESVLRLGVYGGERFVEEAGLEPGVKERGSYGW